jgi:hypothetical protein
LQPALRRPSVRKFSLKQTDYAAIPYLIYLNELTHDSLASSLHRGKRKEDTMPEILPQQKGGSFFFPPVLAWCADRLRATARFARECLRPTRFGDAAGPGCPSSERVDLPRYSYDASLLFRRMAALRVDRDEVASDDPLLFRELQALCTLCRSKERCVLDLAQEPEDGNESWREYCLNGTTLNALGAVQNCARARQYLQTPRSTGYLANE